MRRSLNYILLAALSIMGLASCATTDEAAPKKVLKNPGDEFSVRAWGLPTRSSHVASPFGLPMSQ